MFVLILVKRVMNIDDVYKYMFIGKVSSEEFGIERLLCMLVRNS